MKDHTFPRLSKFIELIKSNNSVIIFINVINKGIDIILKIIRKIITRENIRKIVTRNREDYKRILFTYKF